MKYEIGDMVQRAHNFCIVDEVDSILIDEARTPLIISGPSDNSLIDYKKIDNLCRKILPEDISIDEKSKQVWKKGKKSIQIKRTVCGGTCFDCVEDHFRKNIDTFDGYIVLTDGCAAKPKPCKLRRCWVLLPGYKLYFDPDRTDVVAQMD